jgi:accessory gene regulator protein AgrB
MVRAIVCVALLSYSGLIMLGLTFWKYASGEKTEPTAGGQLSARRQRQQKLKVLVLLGAAFAIAAIAAGLPVVGLSAYLLTSLPFVLFAS